MDFPPDEAIFLQEYSAYCKKKWCPAGGKDPLFGRVDGFQIDPNTNVTTILTFRTVKYNIIFKGYSAECKKRGRPTPSPFRKTSYLTMFTVTLSVLAGSETSSEEISTLPAAMSASRAL